MHKIDDIFLQLEEMSAPQDSVVIFHSSLKLIGEVEGGGEGLLNALIDYFTKKGGLFCVPTHTWSNFGKDVPTLDLTKTETNLGAFPLIAANDIRGVRTLNPTHSMVIFGDGDKIDSFVAGEENIINPVSPESCYGKILDYNGYVLLAGVNHSKNTFLHTVEEIVNIPGRISKTNTPVTIRTKSGKIIKRDWYMFDEEKTGDVSLRFPKYELPFRYHKCIRDGYIGDAPAQLCSANMMKNVIELIYKNSLCDPLIDEHPIPPSLYFKGI